VANIGFLGTIYSYNSSERVKRRLSYMHTACFWCSASGVSATGAVSSIRLCMHMCMHEAVRSLRTAWAERTIETKNSVISLVCCSTRPCFT